MENNPTPTDHKILSPFKTIPTFKLEFKSFTPIIDLIFGINLINGNPHPKAKEAKLKALEIVGAFENDSKFVKKHPKQYPIE